VAWIAGLRPEHSVPIVVIGPGGDSTAYLVPLRLPFVRSVLPADTTGLRPKPAKPPLPLGRPREWYRLALVGLAVAAALTVLAWLYRRRRRPVAAIPLDPREAALAELERLRAGVLEPLRAGPVDASAYAAAYTAGLRVLREFVAAVRPDWGLELTGGELVERLAAARLPAETTGELRSLVGRAEPVKFAGTEPAFADAERFWAGLEAWVASFPLPAEPGPREAA
jgi:hypothetical protein